jgi:hypothetical protein
MNVTITIPDNIAPRVLDGMATAHGWTPEMGVPKAKFCKDIILQFIERSVVSAEGNEAASTAGKEARQKAEDEIVLS